MKFNYVRFRNFLSFSDETCTINLADPGITLVTGENQKDGGSNGSGKSTAIVDSIVYALFGSTTKKLNAEQVINNKNKSDCYVEISFDINQDSYIIRRYRAHTEFGNKLVFEKNGEDLSREKSRDTQDLIESTIRIGFKSFVLSIVLSQENVADFAKTDPTERKRIIENLLMFDFISKYHKGAKEILRKINPQLEILRNSLSDKKDTINTLTNNLVKYAEKWENDETAKKDRINTLQNQITELKRIDTDNELKVREIIHRKMQLLDEFALKKATQENSISQNNTANEVLKKKLRDKEKEIERINKNPEACPVCGSKIKDELFENYLEKQTLERDSLESDILILSEKISQAVEKVNELGRNIREENLEITHLNSNINLSLADEELQNIQQTITRSESEISILTSQLNKNIEDDEYIKNTQLRTEELRKDAKKIRHKIIKLESDASYYEWWKNALGNSPNSIKSFCVNHILKSLNKYINYYLNFFNYDISYNLDVELEDTIVKDNELTTFSALSAGEKRTVEISLIFALYEIIRLRLPDNINIIVLDELLSNHLDDVRIGGALEILNELEDRKLSIFVIDHKNLIKENLNCKMINVIKDKDGLSNLEIA